MKAWQVQKNGTLKFKRKQRLRNLQPDRLALARKNAQSASFMAKYGGKS